MKILFATDGSDASNAALAALIARLGWFREVPELTLLTVHAAIPYRAAAAWAGKQNLADYYDEEAETMLSPARASLAAANVAFDAVKRVGEPADEIIHCASERGVDLIVMGTHGRTALANLVVGSVATKVLAQASTPVLLLH